MNPAGLAAAKPPPGCLWGGAQWFRVLTGAVAAQGGKATSRWMAAGEAFLPLSCHSSFSFTPRSSAPTPRRMRSAEFYKIAIQEGSAVFN